MPNTNPATDNAQVALYVAERGRQAGFTDVIPAGTITMGRSGEKLGAAEVERVGLVLLEALRSRVGGSASVGDVRGMGLLLGIEFVGTDGVTPAEGAGARVAARLLRDGLIVLPAGERGEVLELTPPVVLADDQMECAVNAIASAIEEVL